MPEESAVLDIMGQNGQGKLSVFDRLKTARITRLLLVSAAICVSASVAWTVQPQHSYPDSFWYGYKAFRLAGQSRAEAARNMASVMCPDFHAGYQRLGIRDPWQGTLSKGSIADCEKDFAQWPVIVSGRYQRIFSARPVYPFLMSVAVRLFGLRGFEVGSFALALVAGAAIVLMLRQLRLSYLACVVGVVFFFALPTGGQAVRFLPEGLTLALEAALIATILAAISKRISGWVVWLLIVSLITALVFTKEANAFAVCGAIVAVLAVATPFDRSRIRTALIVGIPVISSVGLSIIITEALGYPRLTESFQDLLTLHFRLPDSLHVWHGWWHDLSYGVGSFLVPILVHHPLLPTAFVVASAIVIWRRRLAGAVIIAAGFSGLLVWAGHPYTSELRRLSVGVWLVPIVALGVATDAIVGRRKRPSITSLLDVEPLHPVSVRVRVPMDVVPSDLGDLGPSGAALGELGRTTEEAGSPSG